ncbi:hypothetical protein J2Z49_001916 [Desulfofundulus luciae]|uniref:Uncharacterized protein n=1 Tax=Desulfofundulus luciae TaxID=74702 RepID=A0ABU0B241_9FIRM|nr:hypothetical protein [Desulfofundulus luciae]MDQ0286799.1 hypothetical protein [Desulfofundulus luciae]
MIWTKCLLTTASFPRRGPLREKGLRAVLPAGCLAVPGEVHCRLKETPEEYLDLVWQENPLEDPDNPSENDSSDFRQVQQGDIPEKRERKNPGMV